MPDEPGRRTRIGLLAAAGAILVAGATAAAVTAAASPGQPRQYWALPGACSLVKPATLEKYVPSTLGSPLTLAAPRAAGCTWSSPFGRSVTLSLVTDIAENSAIWSETVYATAVAPDGLTPEKSEKGVKVTSADEPVPGLGRTARATQVTVSHAGSGNSRSYELTLDVQSGNAAISLYLGGVPAAYAGVSPADAARQAGLIAIARDVLAALPKK